MPGEHAFEGLYELEANNFWFRARNELIIWPFRNILPMPRNFWKSVAVNRPCLKRCAKSLSRHATVRQRDLLQGPESFARQRIPDATFIQMDARRVPYAEEFDLIGAFDVIEAHSRR